MLRIPAADKPIRHIKGWIYGEIIKVLFIRQLVH